MTNTDGFLGSDHPILADPGYQDALAIIGRLEAAGHEAMLVGGPVRDLALGRRPKDFDVATSATPKKVARLFRRVVPVGVRFGVMLVLMPHSEVEVATYRSEDGYADGRHPENVRFSSHDQDVLRRDFTVNGLLYRPGRDQLIDLVGGMDDLRAKRLRAIGDPRARFGEDHLRMLRAVRFAARLSFDIEESTWAALQELAPHVATVSRERIREELSGIWTGGAADRGLDLLDRSGLLAVVLPEVHALKGVAQPPQFHPEGDVFEHTRLMMGMLEAGCSRTLAWAALLHDIGKPATFDNTTERIRFNGHDALGARMSDEILTSLAFKNTEREQVVRLVRDHLKFIHVRDMREAKLKRFIRQDGFDEHLELHRLDCASSHGLLDLHAFVSERLATLDDDDLRPPGLINGHDLKALGYIPGPAYKTMLAEIEDRQLAGELLTKDQALRFVAEQFPLKSVSNRD